MAAELISVLVSVGRIEWRGGMLKSTEFQIQACVSTLSCRDMLFFLNSNTYLQKAAGRQCVYFAGDGRNITCHFALSKWTCFSSRWCYW